MKCNFCGMAETSLLTSLDIPICLSCVKDKNFTLCTETGKYIADKNFTCSHICSDCEHEIK